MQYKNEKKQQQQQQQQQNDDPYLLIYIFPVVLQLTPEGPTQKDGQTHSNN